MKEEGRKLKGERIEEKIILKRFLQLGKPEQHEAIDTETAGSSSARIEDLQRNLDVMNATRTNFAFRTIYSCRKYIGGVIVFCKRVVRKCLKWYLEPVCFQQTDFNNATTLAMDRVRELQLDTLGRLDVLDIITKEQDARVDERIEALEKTLKEAKISERIVSLERSLLGSGLQMDEVQKLLKQHDELIGILTVEHNGRLDIVERRLTELEDELGYSKQNICTAQTQLAQLREQGAFDYIVQDMPTIRRSASQSGEDGIISHVLRVLGIPEDKCSYLDLGANHAKYLSNTYYFYQLGARGVLVEANPGLLGELKLYRSGDVILNRCVSETGGEKVPFYVLNGDGLSTPDKAEAEAAISANPTLRITHVLEVETVSINELMDTYFDGAPIFLNVDIEGREMEILHSLDLETHRPLAISIEVIPYRHHLVIGEKKQEIVDFMSKMDYVEYAFTGINSIFLDKRQLGELQV